MSARVDLHGVCVRRSPLHPPRLHILSGILAGMLVASAGCALIPHRHPSEPVIIPTEPEPMVDSLATIPMGPPDSLAHVIVEPETPPRARPQRPSAPSPAPENPSPQPASPPQETGPEPSISVEISDADRERLETSYRNDIDSADRTITRLSESWLPQEDSDKLQNARGLVAQSKAAFEQQDLQAAANLAHKARVLAEEIASR